MEETHEEPPSFIAKLKSQFKDPRILLFIALALAAGAAGAALGYRFYLKPIKAVADTRFKSHEGLMKLYDLQIAYHGKHGVYADGLDTLLASTPEGGRLRDQLAATMDITTLAVIGGKDRFRLEANVLDQKRTPVKIRGPLGER